LNDRRENIVETYYAMSLCKGVTLTFDYQFLKNPAYNADRADFILYRPAARRILAQLKFHSNRTVG
jgi:high affinity Mn2+ porin